MRPSGPRWLGDDVDAGRVCTSKSVKISPWSLRALKRQLYADQLRSLDEAATDAECLMHDSFDSPDFKEGVAALTEKRPPNFGNLA